MLRSDFENHDLWSALKEVDRLVAEIEGSEDVSDVDITSIQELQVQTKHVRRWYRNRNSVLAFFAPRMLEEVNTIYGDVVNLLASRLKFGSSDDEETREAARAAESALYHVGTWPPLKAKLDQEYDATLFEDLLETQRIAIEKLSSRHASLLARIDELEQAATERAEKVSEELDDFLSRASATETNVANSVQRLDSAVDRGTSTIADLRNDNAAAFDRWREEREGAFESDFAPFKERIEELSKDAAESLDRLRKTEGDFENLSARAAADKLAGHYKTAAESARKLGLGLVIAGVATAVLGLIPLGWFLVETGGRGASPDWQWIVVRISIAAIAASAGAVFVRQGSRYLADATAVQRTELELRTLFPLMANFDEENRTKADDTVVAFVNRAFGQATPVSNDKDSVAVPTAVLDVISSALKSR